MPKNKGKAFCTVFKLIVFFPVHSYRINLICKLSLPLFPGKGGKNRRRGKNENEAEKRELIFKEDGQEYAQVTKMLGNGRLEAMCFDGVKRLCHIRGKLRKKVSPFSKLLLYLGENSL